MNGAPTQKNIRNHFRLALGGESGFGIKITGQMFSRMMSRGGLHIFEYVEYPSLIKGGHNIFRVTVAETPLTTIEEGIDLLVAFTQETVDRHLQELHAGSAIIYDTQHDAVTVTRPPEGVLLFPAPLAALSVKACADIHMRNVVALGIVARLTGYPMELLEGVIHTAFDRKGPLVVDHNIKAAHEGYAFAQQYEGRFGHTLTPVAAPKRMVMNGNTALALGALHGGCDFFAGYPMTPVSSILTYLAGHADAQGVVVRHAEDEIAVINSAIGASFAGARAMIATAGGGFSLMVEGLGLAGMTETPLVIVVGQRPGPATGLPTWTSQGDLQFVLNASQDEFPRIVLAPGDPRECFDLAAKAFNLAAQYQLPVFLLTDKFLGECNVTMEPFGAAPFERQRGAIEEHPHEDAGGMFPRYRVTASGVSPRTLPGTHGGIFLANSDEHDAYGHVDESAENRVAMMDKRMRKLEAALHDLPLPVLYGPHEAQVTLIGWGSTKGPLLDAAAALAEEGIVANVLHFVSLFPLDVPRLQELFRTCRATIVVEGNATGQFARHLQASVGLLPEHVIRKYDGRPLLRSDIVRGVTAYYKTHGTR